jgi:hypothetical protein
MYRVATYEKLRRAGNFAFKGCVKTGDVGAADYFPGTPSNHSDAFDVCGD